MNNQGLKDMYQAIDGWLKGENVEKLLQVPQDYKPKF